MTSRIPAAVLAVAISLPAYAMKDNTDIEIIMDHDATLKNSMDYVRALQNDCIRTDGYRCLDKKAIAHAGKSIVPGNHLKAWHICYEDFLNIKELTDEQKQLRHYNIRIAEEKDYYIVEFLGLLLPYIEQGVPVSVVNAVFGQSMKYWVQKDTLEVSRRLFYK